MKKIIFFIGAVLFLNGCASDDSPSASDSLYLPETILYNDSNVAESAEISYDSQHRIATLTSILQNNNFEYSFIYNDDNTLHSVDLDGLNLEVEYANGRMSAWIIGENTYPISYSNNSYFVEDFEVKFNADRDVVAISDNFVYTFNTQKGVFADVIMDETVKVFMAYFFQNFAAGFSIKQLQTINNATVNTSRNSQRMVSSYSVNLDGLPVTYNYYYIAVAE